MRSLTLPQIADFVQGKTESNEIVDHVVIDSREARQGSLFVALLGENVDGHQFVPDVLAKGGCALVKEGSYSGKGIIEVADPLLALQDLATNYLATYPVPVIAVTGSNGKTSTKDMILQVLQTKYSVHATEGNYNNEIGVPLTVLGLNAEHEILVVEMGMRGLGQITRLTEICPPNYGVLTNIGPVHLEILGSMGNIAQAKGELLEAMGAEGVAILNGDDPSVRGQARSFKGEATYYGLDIANDLIARNIQMDGEGRPSFEVEYNSEEVKVHLATHGVHNVWNACAALTVGSHFSISLAEGAQTLKELSLSSMRLEVQRSAEGIIIVNDCYNSSPASAKTALDTLAHMYCSGRRIAILGSMLELGELAEESHLEVGRHAKEAADRLIFIGEFASVMREAAQSGEVYASVDEFLQIDPGFVEGDLLLIKASRGLQFERIVEKILNKGD